MSIASFIVTKTNNIVNDQLFLCIYILSICVNKLDFENILISRFCRAHAITNNNSKYVALKDFVCLHNACFALYIDQLSYNNNNG
jgi:hypothetical protein